MARLAGKVAIVTGGAKGIGRHYSQALAAEGARVMIADIADGRDLADEIAATPRRQFGRPARSSTSATRARSRRWCARPSSASARSTCWSTTPRFIRTLTPRNFNEWDVELWDRVMAINVRGPFLMVRHVAPHMIERKTGKIINIASGAAYKGVPRMLPYVTSQGRACWPSPARCRASSAPTASRSIRCRRAYPVSDTGLENATPCRGGARAGAQFAAPSSATRYPEDLLGTLVFLASSDSDFVTGQSIVVDGGSVNN